MIEVNSISKRYGKQHILNNISFTANPGDCVGIIGINGSGKTTLLSILSGYKKPDCGEIYYDGKLISDSPDLFSKHISYVPQDNPLIEELTVKDNLRLWYADSTLDLNNELNNGVLRKLAINEFVNKKVSSLSGGMKKRLSIGIALANNPKVLIMDEPSSSLDLACKSDIRSYISSFIKEKGIVIIATHDESEIKLCNKLYILKDCNIKNIDSNLKEADLISRFKSI